MSTHNSSDPPPSRRTVLKGGVVGLTSLTAGPMLWARPGWSSAGPAGVHLTFGADPAREMAVSWSTPGSVADAALEVGTDSSYGLTLPADSRSAPLVGTVDHHSGITALDPGVTYHYRISHRGGDPVTGTFRTAPARADGFRFAAFGDMGVNTAAAGNVAQVVAARPDFAFVVGDLCYADLSGGTSAPLAQDPTLWDKWFAQIQRSAGAMPWMTTVGNHEMERGSGELGYDGYLARFTLPGNGAADAPVTYAFRYGNTGFIALDGNDASYEINRNADYIGAVQDRWLRESLAALRADATIDFIVVGFHNCMYCSNLVHGSDGGHRDRWGALLDEFTVDLVINGHNHGYERTHPVRSGVPVREAPVGGTIDSAQGTTYLTAGGGGQAEYPTGDLPASYVVDEDGHKNPETTEWSSTSYLAHSIAIVDVTPRDPAGTATMKITGISPDGPHHRHRNAHARQAPFVDAVIARGVPHNRCDGFHATPLLSARAQTTRKRSSRAWHRLSSVGQPLMCRADAVQEGGHYSIREFVGVGGILGVLLDGHVEQCVVRALRPAQVRPCRQETRLLSACEQLQASGGDLLLQGVHRLAR